MLTFTRRTKNLPHFRATAIKIVLYLHSETAPMNTFRKATLYLLLIPTSFALGHYLAPIMLVLLFAPKPLHELRLMLTSVTPVAFRSCPPPATVSVTTTPGGTIVWESANATSIVIK